MKDLTPYWHTPDHQPTPESPVSFQLRPLDMPTFWAVNSSLDADSRPSWQGVATAFEYAVLDWKGLPVEFSRDEKRRALRVFDRDMMIWLGQICGQLYTTALLTETERKNS